METEQKQPIENLNQAQLTCLMAALNEVQQTIRAYDTKAQIMGVGFIFSVTMIGNLLKNLEYQRDYDLPYLIIGFILLLGPVTLFGTVLYPTRRTAPRTQKKPTSVNRCFYFRSDGEKDLDAYLTDITSADWTSEIAYEITRLSALRDLKRNRFVTAMFACGASFALILIGTLLKMMGFT